MTAVRAKVVLRDGYCRLQGAGLGLCGGPSEWAHRAEYRRSQTRGQAPERRHTTGGTLMACRAHHARLDGRARPRITERALGPHGADGPLRWESGGQVYREAR